MRVAVCPEQIDAEFTARVGVAFTVTVVVFEEEQEPLLPLTVYTVVVEGVTVTLVELEPVLQVYVFAPVEVRVADCPAHTVAEFTASVGVEFTETVAVLTALQLPFAPVTL